MHLTSEWTTLLLSISLSLSLSLSLPLPLSLPHYLFSTIIGINELDLNAMLKFLCEEQRKELFHTLEAPCYRY